MSSAAKKLPSQKMLKNLLNYDPATGTLTWKERTPSFAKERGLPFALVKLWNEEYSGRPALNGLSEKGYLGGTLLGKKYLSHRVIWKLVHGTEPIQVDHINGVRDDNRIANLRNATFTQNSRNAKRRIDNTSGVNGVNWDAERQRWRARIKLGHRDFTIGRFDRFEDAVEARLAASRQHEFHENHGR